MIEVSTTYITEKWVWLACHNERFSTFSADGTASNFDSLEQLQRLHEMSLDLNTKYKHWRRHFFPPEVLESLVNYFERSPNMLENVEHWARNYGSWRDVMWFGYRCIACGKLRRIGLLYMEAVRLLIPPLMRRYSQLGVACTQMVTTQILHLTIEALTLQTEQLPPQLRSSIMSRGSQSVVVDINGPTLRPSSQGIQDRQLVQWQDIPSPLENKMNGDQKALKLLQAMEKQGNLVSNYDGTGGQTALDVWSEGLYRHFKLFEIEDSESEVTLAACFLKGRAKEWWEKMCHTKQHLEIRNLPNFIEALNHEFRPLNEDLRLTNQWKMLTQRGDLNTFKMEVTKLRGQFPFDEAAEFHLTFHALKRELRGPFLNELWRREVRHLKIDDLFKLAGQAESTWLFLSPNQNSDQGRNQNGRNFNRNGGRYDFPRQLNWNDHDRRDNWPPMTRPPIQIQTTTSTRNNFGRNAK